MLKLGNSSQHQARFPHNNLSPRQKEEIRNYLVNPTNYGVWRLEASWVKNNPFVTDFVELTKSPERINQLRYRELIDTKRSDIILTLYFLSWLADAKFARKYVNSPEGGYRLFYINRILADASPLRKKLKNKYKDEIRFFKENISYENAHISRRSNILSLKQGVCILYQGESSDEGLKNSEILITALNYEVINSLKQLLEKLEIIEGSEITRVFSPEKDVFAPFMDFLRIDYEILVKRPQFQSKINKSISEYDDEEYEHSVSTVGILSEEIFTLLYESLFRQSCPKRMTLNDLYRSIGMELSKLVKKEKPIPHPSVELLKKLNSILEQKSITKHLKESLNLLRESHLSLMEKNAQLEKVVKPLILKAEKVNIFPKNIKILIDELIRYRNAASHNSTIPVSEYEAKRALYCCISLLNWWYITSKQIDWKGSKEEIIETLITLASSA